MESGPMSDDDILDYALEKRKTLVDQITSDGVPKDNDERKMMLDALSGMERTALGKMRIRTDKQIASDDILIARETIDALNNLSGNPFEGTATGSVPHDLGTLYDGDDILESEMVLGLNPVTYEDIEKSTDIGKGGSSDD